MRLGSLLSASILPEWKQTSREGRGATGAALINRGVNEGKKRDLGREPQLLWVLFLDPEDRRGWYSNQKNIRLQRMPTSQLGSMRPPAE